ncbi:MAG: PEP/pyruvate-binding domain-containing protein [Candidatus Gracilibacteria bacterium]
MTFLKKLSEITKNDVRTCGGKGASLGEMMSAGIPVPNGFVVLTDLFQKFLKDNGLMELILKEQLTLDLKDAQSFEQMSKTVRTAFKEKSFPEDVKTEIFTYFKEFNMQYVAVRSSATSEDSSTESWAGELETYLNTTEENLLENIKLCWSSLFTPRALFYAFEKNISMEHIGVAVVVQKMIASEVSGVAFTVHPVTKDHDQIVIEAGFGLGEAIVGGYITPDNYVVQKSTNAILESYISYQERKLMRDVDPNTHTAKNTWIDLSQEDGEKQKLSNEQIANLATILKRIETHYAAPCDIEWAFAEESFVMTQCRPITTL